MADVEEKIPTEGGIGFKVPASVAESWSNPPALKADNEINAVKHYEEYAPKAQVAVAAISPNATPEQHLAGADALKAFSGPKNNNDFAGSTDTRWDEVFSAKDIGGIIRGLNGGADVREIGRNGSDIPVVTVYNGRGDVRRYEWINGERISPEDLAKLGPIASVRNISAERAATYKARGLTGTQVMAAQAQSWGDTLKATKTIAEVGSTLADTAEQRKVLAKELVPFSTNPATRTLLSRINTLTASKSQQASLAREQLDRFSNGKASIDEWNNFNKEHGGLFGGMQYGVGKGLTVGNNERVTDERLNDLSNKIARSNSSDDKIQSNAQNLLNQAQMLAAKGEIQNFDKISQLVGLTAQTAMLENRLQQVGGVPGFVGAPNVSHSATDSFSLNYANAEYASALGKAASAYAKHIVDSQSKYGLQAPPIGAVESEFAASDFAKTLRKDRTGSISNFYKEVEPVLKKLNEQSAYPEVQKVISGQPVAAPTISEEQMPSSRIPGAKAPNSNPKQKQQSTMSDLLNQAFPVGGKK